MITTDATWGERGKATVCLVVIVTFYILLFRRAARIQREQREAGRKEIPAADAPTFAPQWSGSRAIRSDV